MKDIDIGPSGISLVKEDRELAIEALQYKTMKINRLIDENEKNNKCIGNYYVKGKKLTQEEIMEGVYKIIEIGNNFYFNDKNKSKMILSQNTLDKICKEYIEVSFYFTYFFGDLEIFIEDINDNEIHYYIGEDKYISMELVSKKTLLKKENEKLNNKLEKILIENDLERKYIKILEQNVDKVSINKIVELSNRDAIDLDDNVRDKLMSVQHF